MAGEAPEALVDLGLDYTLTRTYTCLRSLGHTPLRKL
jgi:hypothetical protein